MYYGSADLHAAWWVNISHMGMLLLSRNTKLALKVTSRLNSTKIYSLLGFTKVQIHTKLHQLPISSFSVFFCGGGRWRQPLTHTLTDKACRWKWLIQCCHVSCFHMPQIFVMNIGFVQYSGRSGLMVAYLTTVCKILELNESHYWYFMCFVRKTTVTYSLWAPAAQPYCSVQVDSAFDPLYDSRTSISCEPE